MSDAVRRHVLEQARRLGHAVIDLGVSPAWLGYRAIRRESLRDYSARRFGAPAEGRCETVHPEGVVASPLPCNVAARDLLPGDRGWWGFSFRDVPFRRAGETLIATIPGAWVVWYRDAVKEGDFFPAILTRDGRALDLREVRFRPAHADVLRRSGPPHRLPRATWIIERVYHNHAHWLTAHLPKLLLLRQRQALADVLLPSERTPVMDASLRLLGLDPGGFPSFDPQQPLLADELTLVSTDRFRPELVRLVPEAFGVLEAPPPRRRVFISRAGAARRRLTNEPDVWALLQRASFDRVVMEELSFERQVALMKETAVLCAPHGAGLASMMFCPRGAHVVELADPENPNPNFYALAAALGHHYWWLPGQASARQAVPQPAWRRDFRADIELLREVLARLPSRA